MGCPELDMTSYLRFVKPDENPHERLESPTKKTAYSRFSRTVTDDKIGNRKYAFLSEKGIEKFKTDFEYNGLNQIAEQGFQYDAYGNLIKSQDTEYVYDLNNRLTEVKKPNITVKYSYDPLGQRIKSEESTAGGAKTSKVTQFLMSGMIEQARITDSVAQYHTFGLDLAQSLTATGGVGAVLASTSYSGSSNSDTLTLSYLYDGNGNVIASIDSTGTITAKLAFSPFGEKLSGTNLPFSFSTKSVDSPINFQLTAMSKKLLSTTYAMAMVTLSPSATLLEILKIQSVIPLLGKFSEKARIFHSHSARKLLMLLVLFITDLDFIHQN